MQVEVIQIVKEMPEIERGEVRGSHVQIQKNSLTCNIHKVGYKKLVKSIWESF